MTPASPLRRRFAAYYNDLVSSARLWAGWMMVLAALGATASSAQAVEEVPVDPLLQPTVERLEAALAELAQTEKAWMETDRAERAETSSHRESIAILEAEFAAAERHSEEIDRLFDRVSPLVVGSLDEVKRALQMASRPSELPGYAVDATRSQVSPFGQSAIEIPGTVGAELVESLEREVREEGARLQELELKLRMDDVARDLQVAGRLYRLRLDLLEALPLERRRRVFSLGLDAPSEVALEFEALQVVARYQAFRARGFVAGLGLMVRDLFATLMAGKMLVKLIVIFLVWRWVQRGRPAFIRRLRLRARAVGDPRAKRWASGLADFLEAIAPWGIFLLAVMAFGWAVETDVGEIPYLLPLVSIAVAYGLYRVVSALATGTVVGAMKNTGVEASASESRGIASGIRWIMRFAAVFGYLLWFLSLRLGEGVLFALLRRAGLTIVALVVLVVALRFRSQVRGVFLALKAHGWLADLVRASGNRASDLVVTPLALLWLSGRGLVGVVRGLAFSFERTRSATAYMSRRRMAKVALQRGPKQTGPEELTPTLVAALADRVTVADLEATTGFPGLEQARSSAAAWREGTATGSLLVAAEEGLGKVAWLEKFLAAEEGAERYRLEERILDAVHLRQWMADHLLAGKGVSLEREELIEQINSGPRRTVVLEGGHNLFLATVNGYEALAELGPIVDATRKRVFWVLTMGGLAWNHLRAAGKELAFLRRKIVLEPFDEEAMTSLIDRRLEESGYEVSFADLMAMEGRREDEAARDRLGRQTYFNLLADFSAGNPQIGLHFFLRSLEPVSESLLRVHAFETPAEEDLIEGGPASLFLLAALMRHGALDVEEAATTTAYPAGKVEGLILRLLDLGTIAERENAYFVTTNWRATVLQVLRRRNILVS